MNVLPLTIVFCLCIAGAAATPVLEGSVSDAISLYNNAVDDASSGKYEEALKKTDEALGLVPNFTLALVRKTGILIELNRFNEANETVSRALALEPDDAAVLAAASSFAVRTGQFEKGKEYALHSVRVDPNLTESWILLSTSYAAEENWTESLKAVEQALARDPTNLLAMQNREDALSHLFEKKNIVQGGVPTETPSQPAPGPDLLAILIGCMGVCLLIRRT